ncbi:MAG: CRISPR-associated protein Cas4 [Sedimentibacter sp.]|uniref:CRISPR-associated protein Cas4 n=1 Tax=Sedimentibacter sp. TaxID=1960295 RepID=UPI0029814FB6|nr:CRISPR-associated protein Cas4 [Sedimentibacter sp.]MDW5298891.1 CRISPR-associated protein Cas4 [Sedimentibacter sp.]
MDEFNVSGTYVWYYCICKREVWLLAHALEADQQDENMQMGNLIHETSYSRNSKEVGFGHSKFDVISRDDGKLIVGEMKKSSRFIGSSRMQLLFYLKELSDNNIEAEGVLLFPDEKKREVVILDEESKLEIENIIKDINHIVNLEHAPLPVMNKYCKKCAYAEFCWA